MNIYLKELINHIQNTEFLSGISRKCESYGEGISLLVDKFTWHKERESQVYFIGNGGSSAIASHMTADFMKNGGMKTCSLYDSAVMTCMGNDYGYSHVFSKPLELLLRPGDLLVAISSSGNSENIVSAVKTARERGAAIITFTGFRRDNRVKQAGDVNVYVPCEKYGMVESIHNLILQQVVDEILSRDGVF